MIGAKRIRVTWFTPKYKFLGIIITAHHTFLTDKALKNMMATTFQNIEGLQNV